MEATAITVGKKDEMDKMDEMVTIVPEEAKRYVVKETGRGRLDINKPIACIRKANETVDRARQLSEIQIHRSPNRS